MATKPYKTLKTVRFGQGDVLDLSEAQAAARASLLEATGGGLYTARGPVEFKRGEVIGLVDVPKRLADLLQPVMAAQGRKTIPKPPEPGTAA